jgi:hypothetical protein
MPQQFKVMRFISFHYAFITREEIIFARVPKQACETRINSKCGYPAPLPQQFWCSK